MTTSDAARTRPKGREGTGITLRAFRLNAAVNHLMFTGRRGRVYDRIVALSGVRPGDSVLDVGSSNGYLATRLAAAGPAIRVTGVDPSEPAIAYARRHASPGMTFTVGVAQDLRWPDASFDVVTCTLAMHHIPRRQRPAAFAEICRVTKPGGRLLAADMAPLLHFSDRLTGSHRRRPGRRRAGSRGSGPRLDRPAWRPRRGGRFPDRVVREAAAAALHRGRPAAGVRWLGAQSRPPARGPHVVKGDRGRPRGSVPWLAGGGNFGVQPQAVSGYGAGGYLARVSTLRTQAATASGVS